MFVIEKGSITDPEFLTITASGQVGWGGDLMAAMGFARQVDAENYVAAHIRGIMAVDEYRIVELDEGEGA